MVHIALLEFAENERQHIVEVHTYIGGDSARLCLVALPRHVIPSPTRGDVGEVYLVHAAAVAAGYLVAQGDNCWMQPKLQDSVHLAARFVLGLHETVDIPGIEHQWLFADRLGAVAEREAHMRVVQIVWRANADQIDLPALTAASVNVAIEALELHEKPCVREVAVKDSH